MKKSLKLPRLILLLLCVLLLATGCSLLPSASSVSMNALEDGDATDTVTITRDEYDRLERYASLDDLTKIVQEYYYVDPDLDTMLEGAKRGLLAGLGDPYTFYYSADEFSAMWEDDEGEYAGIGIQISASYETLLCTISRVFSGSPAAEAGLRKGDVLYKVDDLDVDASTLNEAVSIMRGEVGTTVNVQVLRDGQALDFTVPRAVVHVNWVSSAMLDNQVGYLLLYEFSGDCADTFKTQLEALVAQGAKALILDLRDNPGGWIENAVSIADHFLPEETVTYLEYRDGSRDYYNATEGALNLPMVVLMNENAASSSEILAGALQDYGVATIIGTQSYGKGVVQFVLPVGNTGEGMQLTAALYYTPNGRSIHKVGITPDMEVAMPEGDQTLYQLGDLTDAQLNAAYEYTLQMLAGNVPAASPTPVPTIKDNDAVPAAEQNSPAEPSAADFSYFRVS